MTIINRNRRNWLKIYFKILKSLLFRGVIPEGYRPVLHQIFIRYYDRRKLSYIAKTLAHFFGPKIIPYNNDEAIVLCLVKNGEVWIKEFIEYYFKKGFKHIVFLDNGSTDNTLNIAKKYTNITILRTSISFKDNNLLLRRYLIKRFSKNKWSLTVDIDEFWDYPFSDIVNLSDLLEYLKKKKANALVAQILDMFTRRLPSKKIPLKKYCYYNISTVKKDSIAKLIKLLSFSGDKDVFSNKKCLKGQVKFYRGGIRAQLFGLKGIWLTKMPLLFYDKRIQPLTHQHYSNNVNIGDISSVLYHYKLTHLFKKQIEDALKEKQYMNNSSEYVKYAERLKNTPNLNLSQFTIKKVQTTNQLLDENFLVVSPSYLKMVQKTKENKGGI